MRTIWKGHIQFSLVNIPVRLYTAVDSSQSIHFTWLTAEGHHPVGYVKTDKETGEPLDQDDIVKGYEYESDQYVIITDEDIEKAESDRSKVIKIEGFTNIEEIHPALYEKPYFIGPEDESNVDTYRLFIRTLTETKQAAVGRVVLRNKESPALLTTYEQGILMYKLRYPDQMRRMKDVPGVEKEIEVDEGQLEMAKELVGKMPKDFDQIDLENHYYLAMKEMIEDKVEGKEIVSVEEGEPEAPDIMTALKESIASAGDGQEDGQDGQSDGEQENYEDLTKNELYQKAEKAGIKGRSKMNKDELIEELKG
jgi:DNA end-binding protein Ku